MAQLLKQYKSSSSLSNMMIYWETDSIVGLRGTREKNIFEAGPGTHLNVTQRVNLFRHNIIFY